MNRSSKFNFYLPQNTDPIEVSDFNSNFETIDANLLTKAQNLTDAQKAAVRANADLNVANNLTTTAAGSVLDARQGKVLADSFVYITDQSSDSLGIKLKNAFQTISGGNYVVNKSYPVMLYFGGTGFQGTLTGTFNMTSGGIRFLLADESHLFEGLFLRSNNTISSVVDIRDSVKVSETVVSGSLRARKFGKVVCLNGYAAVPISGQTVIGDALPQEYRPSDVIRGICNVGQNAYSVNKIAYVAVGTTSGKVEVTPPDSGSYSAVYMSLSWVVAG